MSAKNKPLVVAVTGASGAPYVIRLLQLLLLSESGREVHLIMSTAAGQVFHQEVGIRVDPDHFELDLFLRAVWSYSNPLRDRPLPERAHSLLCYHHYDDWTAGVASGSFLTSGMVICPCSMSTLGAIAAGLSTNLIQRAADVHLKERRKLILVPREMPLSLIHLENMAQCVRAGAIIMPAMPGWYDRPQSLDDLINFVVGRVCDQLEIPHELLKRWGE